MKVSSLVVFAIIVVGSSRAVVAAPLPPTPTTVTPNAIVTLGTTAGPNPRRGRSQAANLLSINGTLYLIDAGDNATRRIVQSGYDFRKIGKVLITHDHSDHTLGLPTLMVDQWEFQRRDPVDIYGPPGTAATVQGALQFAAVNADIRYSEGKTAPMASIFKAHDVQPGPVFSDANVTVTAVENTHFHFQPGTPPYGKYKSYSYRFNTSHGSIVFTGDTGPSDAVVALAKGADILVSEVLSTDDLIALYTSNGVWQAKTPGEQAGFLRHMHEEHLTPQELARSPATAARSLLKTESP